MTNLDQEIRLGVEKGHLSPIERGLPLRRAFGCAACEGLRVRVCTSDPENIFINR